jgi:hypothetical protein
MSNVKHTDSVVRVGWDVRRATPNNGTSTSNASREIAQKPLGAESAKCTAPGSAQTTNAAPTTPTAAPKVAATRRLTAPEPDTLHHRSLCPA